MKGGAFGEYLRNELGKTGMSLRELAQRCGMDPSTVSRLSTGKQKPGPEHLASIARALRLNVLELWQAAGYVEGWQDLPQESGGWTALDPDACTLPPIEGLDVNRIEAELRKYQQYGQTEEGREIILRDFEKKVGQMNAVGPFMRKLKALHKLYMDEATNPADKRIISGALLYFILPTDIIPDYLFPIGYLDDAVAIDLVWQQIRCPLDESEA